MIANNLNNKIVIDKDGKYKYNEYAKDLTQILGVSDKRNLIKDHAKFGKKRTAVQYRVKNDGTTDDEIFDILIYHIKPLFGKPYAILDAWEAPMFRDVKELTPCEREEFIKLLEERFTQDSIKWSELDAMIKDIKEQSERKMHT